ncbi:MAG: hypothetical protein HQ581_09440 [Planctomycetes bacterium]|nr:hypothetical protein [Planctomycetota bacterium]
MVGDRRYRVDANTATDVTDPDTSKHRRASVSEDYELRWVGAAEGVAFLVADRVREKYDPDKPGTNRRFHRLDLGLMKWLDPFELPEPSIDRYRKNVIHFGGSAAQKPRRHVLADHLLVTPRGIVVLCEETIEQQNTFASDIVQYVSVGYHVSCYAPKSTRVKWNRPVRDGNRGHRVVGYSMRRYDDSIQRLTYVPGSHDDDLILVCRGERDAVTCLAAANGKVCWRIPAIWEYERGFIGPSTFLHYIERFGLDFMAAQAAKSPVLRGNEEEIDRKELAEAIRWKMASRRKLTAARKAFYARYQGRITAGPIVVPDADGFGNPRIYVAATRSLKPEPGCVEQPEHAFVYEIEPHRWGGPEITGMTRLPRAVIGRPYRKVPGGFVLSCSQGCMVRLRTYEPVFGAIMGPGRAADDLILQIDWYREYLMRSPSAWFRADPPTNVAGFSKARLFRPSRAYVRGKEDKVYDLQINVVDLRTGLDRDLTLSVPFEGKLPIPETGLGSFNRGDPTERLYASGPHAVWIDHLGVDGDRLTAVVAHGSQCTALTFDLSAILADEQASRGE